MSVNENQLQIDVILPEISHLPQQTTTEELKNWIKEGKLRPTHQIRIMNLPWVEAQNVPVLKPLFELKQKKDQDRLINAYNQSGTNAPAFDYLRNKASEAAATSVKRSEIYEDLEAKYQAELRSAEKTIATPSIPFKLYEKKVSARAQQNEPDAASSDQSVKPSEAMHKPVAAKSQGSKKSFYAKRILVYLAGCCLMLLLSYGGSYLWVYQFKTAVEIDEKNLPELMNLTNKLTSDKLELRLKTAEKEKELKAANVQEQTAPRTDIAAEIVKLENQYKNLRVNLIEQHRLKLQTDDFNTTFYYSFAVLLSLFLLTNVFVGKGTTTPRGQASPKKPKTEKPDSLDLTDFDEQIEICEEIPDYDEIIAEAEFKSSKSLRPQTAKTASGVQPGVKKSRAENTETEKPAKAVHCLLHQKTAAHFVCGKCTNHFCGDCTVVIEEKENCCPFCKAVCFVFESDAAESEIKSRTLEKDKQESIEPEKIIDNGRRIVREKRTNKVGVLPALVIAFLLSCGISIFWVYKLVPYLENREKEVVRNTAGSQNGAANSSNSTNTQNVGNVNSNSNANTANGPCIDPATRQPFECDEITRNALYEHTRKVESVEKAQKETAEKTDSILGLILPSSGSADGAANQQNPADEARKQLQKQQLIKVFGCSFLTIFGLLMSVRLFSRKEETGESEETEDSFS